MSNYIPENTIAEINQACDIVDIVGDVVVLKKTGKNLIGLCPFHTEKTPSFTVSPDKQMFHCFGCGLGGNALTFLMRYENITFPEAVRMLAKRYGIPIPDRSLTPSQRKEIHEREQLYDAHQQAARFFAHNLLKTSEGKAARDYLQGRQLSPDTITTFQLGFALDSWDSLLRQLNRQKISNRILEKCGLVQQRRKKSGYYDRFRNRIIFPIADETKQIIGFGGRVMDSSLPKYLNSPETALFHKSRALYGLATCKAACRQKKAIYIVEGYMDAIALYQNGIQNVAATMGTALTHAHIRLVKGLIGAKGIVLLVFDSDDAGIQAALRSIDIFQSEFVDVRILILKQGYDPDDFVMEFGGQAFEQSAKNAMGVIAFLLEVNQKKYGTSVEGRVRTMEALERPLASITDKVTRSLYIGEVSEKLGISESALTERIEKMVEPSNGPTTGSIRPRAHATTAVRANGSSHRALQPDGPQYRLERQLVAMVLQYPAIIPDVKRAGIVDTFDNRQLKSIGLNALRLYADKYPEDRARFDDPPQDRRSDWVAELVRIITNEEDASLVTELAMKDDHWHREGCLKLIQQYQNIRQQKRNIELERQIQEAEKNQDQRRLLELLAEKQKQVASRIGRQPN